MADPQQPNEWLIRVLEAAQAAAEDTGSTACEIIAYLGAVPPAHLRPARAPATPMLSAATPSTHVARSPRSSLLAERIARLKQSVQPHSSRTPHIGAPRPSFTPTTRENDLAPSGSEGSAPPVDSLFESARHRYHAQLAEATMQHNQARPTVNRTRIRTRTRTRTRTLPGACHTLSGAAAIQPRSRRARTKVSVSVSVRVRVRVRVGLGFALPSPSPSPSPSP